MRLKNKVALVTGATSGIGRATARAFAREGARVIVAGRDQERGESAVAAIERDGGTAVFVRADLSNREGAEHLAAEARRVFGVIDILVNNAGTFSFGPTAATTEADYDTMMDTNVKAPFFLTAALAPAMAQQGNGKIINITTAAAHAGMPGAAAYGASKAALALLTKSWALEFGPAGVNVNAISPGPIETPGTKAMGAGFGRIVETVPVKRAGQTEEIAAAAVYLASDEADFIHGASLAVDGGLLAD
jgi:NAD(P)-dependent dehydrogenase (short-subunit alcohol dehydrogenase family)